MLDTDLGLYNGLVERPVVPSGCRLHDGGQETLGIEQQRQVDDLHNRPQSVRMSDSDFSNSEA